MTTNGVTRVLLIDDDAASYEITRAVLAFIQAGRYELYWVSTYEEGLSAMTDRRYDLYLLDYVLGARNGLDLLREARRRQVYEPIIILTGHGSSDVDFEASEAGADDYLSKFSLEPDQLERAMRYALARRREEGEIRRSEARYRSLVEHAPVGLFRCTANGGFVEANPALLRLLGHPDGATLHNEYALNFFLHPRDRERFLATLNALGVVFDFRSDPISVRGAPVHLSVTARGHRNGDGSIRYVEGAVRQVPKSAGEDPERSEIRLRRLMEGIGSGIAFTDHEGRVRLANKAFSKASGYSGNELVGLGIHRIVPAADHVDLSRDLHALVQGDREHIKADRRIVTRSGDEEWARITFTSVPCPVGPPPEILVLLEDLNTS